MSALEPEANEPWLDPDSENALRAAIPLSMQPTSAALYARWWQLETWLRELIYVELRALLGTGWTDAVKAAAGRQAQDVPFTHMAGPDNENPLAYLDYSQLLPVIERYWDQFSYALPAKPSWDGRQEDLKRIRHRIGHMRKAHSDDLNRLEQTLRDLERGAFIAAASYNSGHVPNGDARSDPVTKGWIRGHHPDAKRLIAHAQRQYECRLIVQAARRPWASFPSDLAHAPGILWDVIFNFRDSAVDIQTLWHDSALTGVKRYLVHLLADYSQQVRFTFAAADDPTAIADAIGEAFDAVLGVARRADYGTVDHDRWKRRAMNLDYRVMVNAGWNIVSADTLPITTFGAGGGVTAKPHW